MINRGGENAYFIEVENALGAHLAVAEVAVVGVPDPMMGEKVGAVVGRTPGTVGWHELVTFVAEYLADFKVPQYLVIRPEPLPKYPPAKCSRHCCASRSSGEGRSAERRRSSGTCSGGTQASGSGRASGRPLGGGTRPASMNRGGETAKFSSR